MSDQNKTLDRNNNPEDLTQMVDEALKRLKILNVIDDVTDLLRKKGQIYLSERQNIGGLVIPVLYFVDQYDDLVEVINDFEEKHGVFVYHVTKENTEFGQLYDLFYVGKDSSFWEEDKEDLVINEEGWANPYVYTVNMTNSHWSESGRIGIEPKCGGLLRIY